MAMEERIRIADEQHRNNLSQKLKEGKAMKRNARKHAHSSNMLSTIGSNVHDDNKKMYRTRPQSAKPSTRSAAKLSTIAVEGIADVVNAKDEVDTAPKIHKDNAEDVRKKKESFN